jgi:hypothetical protein
MPLEQELPFLRERHHGAEQASYSDAGRRGIHPISSDHNSNHQEAGTNSVSARLGGQKEDSMDEIGKPVPKGVVDVSRDFVGVEEQNVNVEKELSRLRKQVSRLRMQAENLGLTARERGGTSNALIAGVMFSGIMCALLAMSQALATGRRRRRRTFPAMKYMRFQSW